MLRRGLAIGTVAAIAGCSLLVDASHLSDGPGAASPDAGASDGGVPDAQSLTDAQRAGCTACVIAIAGDSEITDLASLAERVYVGSKSTPRGLRLIDGAGSAATPITNNGTTPSRIAIGAGFVYWSDTTAGNLWRAPALGTASTRIEDAEDAPSIVAVGSDRLFWLTPTKIRSAALDGTSSNDLVRVTATSLAVNGPSVYYATPAEVGQIDRSTSMRVVLAADADPRALVATSGALYWSSGATHEIRRYALPSGPVATIATATAPAAALAVDDTFAYWTTTADGALSRVSLADATQSLILASGQNKPTLLTVTPSSIYFYASGSGDLIRLPKP